MRRCRTCRRPFEPAAGNQQYCSQQCRCGTNAGYGAGCKCHPCRAAHARARKRARVIPTPRVSSLGTRRRVQALACLGWSMARLCTELGRERSYLFKALSNDTVFASTAIEVAQLYDRLCMTIPTPTNHADELAIARTRRKALRDGHVPPLAWDEGTIDDPNATPVGALYRPSRGRSTVDTVAVARILAGDTSVATSRAEKEEVCRQWAASGRTLRELGDRTGWAVHRYYRLSDHRDEVA